VAEERVLVVDDSKEIQKALRDLVLEPGGYQVLTANDGAEGLQLILEEHPDLVILDERLPGRSGMEILKALKGEGVQVPVIFITSYGSEDLVVQVFRLGARDYVMKPFKPHEMRRVVDRVMEETRLRAERDGLVQELRILFSIGRSVTSILNLETVLTRVVEAAVFLARAEEGLLLLVEEESNNLVLRAAKNVDEEVAHGLRVRVEDSLAGEVLQSGKPVLVDGRKCKVATGYLVNTLAYVPVRSPERGIIGVLGVANRRSDRSFTQHEVQLLSTLADYAAVALENSRLYEEAETERRKLEAVLQETEEAVIVLDAEQRILLCNPTARAALSLPEDVVGQPATEVISNPTLQEPLRAAAKAKQTLHAEIAVADGRTFNAQLSPVEGVGYVLMMQDITHLKELDRLKSEFIQNVSHELRSPLALIRGYAELLSTGELGELDSQQRGPVEIIARRTRMLDSLVEDITLILEAERRRLQHKPVALDDLTRAAMEDFHIMADHGGITLEMGFASDLPPVAGDPIYLRRMLDNLLNNAIKFTPSGGTVTVDARQQDDQVVLRIADTGIGIPQDQQERVFERFYQVDGSTRRRYGGVGLGLALVKEIVEKHGGSVGVESEMGEGSTFTVSLPVFRG
jgi:two-component system NtrC family sensor kinase